ncbi:MAG TPA: hypothetical protein VJ725_18215 [Thermoanaerobaculia bacterium]|nr:hypothetical protein [Thermoanaerobaculia bacterium]
MTSVTVLERISIVTPLAVRLRDEATLGFVSGALAVAVHPQGVPELARNGIVNRAGIFVFRNLPGLAGLERGSGDAAYWATETPRFDFVLAVSDPAGRFLPWSLPVKLPQRSLLGLGLASPLTSPLQVQTGGETAFLPLFSAASRPVPEGMGGLRTTLWDADRPAAWALVEAKAGGERSVAGLADAQGRVMLPLPYPKPAATLGSPLGGGGPLTRQSWPVAFTVRYRRRTPAPQIPDLADVLTQPPATAWQETSRTNPLTSATLRFGRELVLVSRADGGAVSSTLLITP